MHTDSERMDWMAANTAAAFVSNNEDAAESMNTMGENFEDAVKNGANPAEAMRAAIDARLDQVPVAA